MSGPDLAIVVPARLASRRFPEKLLHPIRGRPLILWTADRIASETPELPLYFAVDSNRLQAPLEDSGYSVVTTDPDLPSGTDRLAAANEHIGAKAVINIQADEPSVEASQIRRLMELVTDGGTDIATLATPFHNEADFLDPSRVKVVLGSDGRALYFSRAPIPYDRDAGGAWQSGKRYLHLGMYAYSSSFLKAFRKLTPGVLEDLEKLEQLRALENGYTIRVGITEHSTFGIDTPEDGERFAEMVK